MNAVRKVRPGTFVAQSLDDAPLAVLAVAAAHALEHRVRRVLQRHVDVRHDARVLREELDERVVERLRIEVEDADPAHALHVRDAAHEVRQAARSRAAPSHQVAPCRAARAPGRDPRRRCPAR